MTAREQENMWKLVVRSVKSAGTVESRVLVEKAILEAARPPLRLREARRQLFLLAMSASNGRPSVIDAGAALICVIALDDLVDVVVEKGPTLEEVMRSGQSTET